jgi:hypothetical protein
MLQGDTHGDAAVCQPASAPNHRPQLSEREAMAIAVTGLIAGDDAIGPTAMCASQ